jgi:predicted transcriptional regulator
MEISGMSDSDQLSRRERQIMDAIYASGGATVSQVIDGIPDPPTRPAVRALLTILERKGHLEHQKKGREFVYRPLKPKSQAAKSALRRVLRTFFQGSLERAVVAHLSDSHPSDEELQRLAELIGQAKRRGR